MPHRIRLAAILGAVMALLALGGPAWAENRVALVIGNSDYGTLGDLPNPANDARLMEQALTQVGFKVTLLTDADQRAMKRAIVDFGSALGASGEDTVGLFFYAGHGVQVRGENFLVPAGADLRNEGDVAVDAVEADWVLAQMELAGNRLNLIILDACRNNPLPERSVRSADRGLARMDAPRGSLVAYSTAPGGVAVDGDGRNSPYTAALAAQIRVPGASIEDVFRQTRLAVLQATGERQVPWESSSLTADFRFTAALPVAIAPVPVAAPAAAVPSEAIEMAFWTSIQGSTDPADYQSYLTQFPNGHFVELARRRAAADPVPAASAVVAAPRAVAAPALAPYADSRGGHAGGKGGGGGGGGGGAH